MFVGNVCYIRTPYNENAFRALLEQHLEKGPATFPSKELIGSTVAAYLETPDSSIAEKKFFESFLEENNLKVSDFRSFSGQKVVGNPEDALKAFKELYIAYLAEIKK